MAAAIALAAAPVVLALGPRTVIVCGKSSTAVAKADLLAISRAVETFRAQHGGRPPESLAQLIQRDATGSRYLDMDELLDPWRREYLYLARGSWAADYLLATYGRDGRPGGEGEDSDITHLECYKRRRR